MTLEDLIYRCLTSDSELSALLTKYGNQPAVFFQKAPDDTSLSWCNRKQYPRIDYAVDMRSNPERKTSGVLVLTILCTKDETPPEEIEPIVRRILCGVFLCPESTMPYSLSWMQSDAFEQKSSDITRNHNLIEGVMVSFDVFAFPLQITTDPDPVLAINRFIKQFAPRASVIGSDSLPQQYTPTSENPAFYFRLENFQTERETNTVVWINATLAGHVFAKGEELIWIKALFDSLALEGRVTMLDTSPMRILKLKADSAFSALSIGQIRITVQFGILRKQLYSHVLVNEHISMRNLNQGE